MFLRVLPNILSKQARTGPCNGTIEQRQVQLGRVGPPKLLPDLLAIHLICSFGAAPGIFCRQRVTVAVRERVG